MPHITTAMERSVRRGVGELLVAKLRRQSNIVSEASNVKNAFSSWSNCMAASYCKWPVIVIIIVFSLILLSIVTCIVRCCCCGMSCCCSCFSFLKCCDCCGDSCAGKKNKPHKHLDEAEYPPRQGYQAPAPMMGGALNSGIGVRPEPPQYAQFEVGKNGLAVDKPNALSEDALPPMPSWDTAAKKHVLTEEEKNAVELGELDPATGQKIPLMTGASAAGTSMPPSPAHEHSPYGPPGQAVGAYSDIPSDPYGQHQNGLAPGGNGRYGSPAPFGRGGPGRGYGQGQGFEGQGRGQFGGPGRGQFDGQGRGNFEGQGRGNLDAQYDGQGRGYGPPSPQDPYGADNNFAGVAVGGYGRPPPNRQNTGDSRPFPLQPQRQYSSDSARPLNGRQYSDQSFDNFQPNGPPRNGVPRGPSRGPGGPGRMASPPLNNNSGFDFGTGAPQQYGSRPSPPPQQSSYDSSNGRPSAPIQQGRSRGNDGYTAYAGSTAPPIYASRSPPQSEAGYPGYRPYQGSSNQGGRGVPASRGREPERWDPVHQ